MQIDNQEYTKEGTVQCTTGSGDNQETWQMDVYKDDQGQTVLFYKDKGKNYLYLPVDEVIEYPNIKTTHESCSGVTIESSQSMNHEDAVMVWIATVKHYDDAPAPFRSTNQAMTITSDSKTDVYLSVALLKIEEHYFSARFPAQDLPQIAVEEQKPNGGARILESLVAVLLLSGLGYGAYTGWPTPLSWFWWSSAVLPIFYLFASPGGFFHDALRFWVGAFFLHFATHLLDTTVTSDYWGEPAALAFESLHAAGIVLLLLILRLAWLRGYCILVDAGSSGGGCAWSLCLVGVAFISMVQEFSYFPWFRWYAGANPWGILWIIVFLYFLWDTYKDYRRAPLTRSEVLEQLNQLHRTLEAGLAAQAHQEDLVRLCDDLEDGVRMSLDPKVIALRGLGNSFLELKTACKNLGELEDLTEFDKQRVTDDLATVQNEVGEILEQFRTWGQGADHQKFRVSPFLLTYDW